MSGCNNLIDPLKSSYYTSIIQEHSADQKILFSTVNKLLQKKTVQHYPSTSSSEVLANNFADVFSDKIVNIHRGLAEKQITVGPSPHLDDVCSVELSEFNEVSEDNVRMLACKPLLKSCQLDPIPAVILKGCFNTLLPIITKIVNLSLSTGVMPDSLKVAELHPSLKKPDADHKQYSSFRPISNLPMLSKVIEKAAADQLMQHVFNHHLDETFQSANKTYHPTETALIKVQNDILCAIDNKKSVILLSLDLAAAFDTVDHSVLLSRLTSSHGLRGAVLAWFRSYLASRKQYVRVEGCTSSFRSLDQGVPQGSVLGPLLYSMCTSPIAKIISRYGLKYHLYADDSQLYISFKTDSHEDLQMVKAKIEMCVKEINAWLVHNGLKLNQDKSELVLFISKFRDEPILDHVEIIDEKIKPVFTSKTLGVILEKYLSLDEHITKICKSAHFHLRNICKIRRYLDGKATEILIHAFVSSKLDYCNSLLYVTDCLRIR